MFIVFIWSFKRKLLILTLSRLSYEVKIEVEFDVDLVRSCYFGWFCCVGDCNLVNTGLGVLSAFDYLDCG